MRQAIVRGPRGGRWRVEVPETRVERARGLLGRTRVKDGAGMLFERARSIHTIGMRFAILAAFLDQHGRVLRVRPLAPRRVVLPRLRVRAVLEVAPSADVREGDLLVVEPVGRGPPPVGDPGRGRAAGRRYTQAAALNGSNVPAPIV